jgi:predicted P-loop ATPase
MAWHELIVGGEPMADAMLDARQEGDSYRRIEVITGQRRRRRWTAEEKSRIVAESFEEGANISEVARRNGVVGGRYPHPSRARYLGAMRWDGVPRRLEAWAIQYLGADDMPLNRAFGSRG